MFTIIFTTDPGGEKVPCFLFLRRLSSCTRTSLFDCPFPNFFCPSSSNPITSRIPNDNIADVTVRSSNGWRSSWPRIMMCTRRISRTILASAATHRSRLRWRKSEMRPADVAPFAAESARCGTGSHIFAEGSFGDEEVRRSSAAMLCDVSCMVRRPLRRV